MPQPISAAYARDIAIGLKPTRNAPAGHADLAQDGVRSPRPVANVPVPHDVSRGQSRPRSFDTPANRPARPHASRTPAQIAPSGELTARSDAMAGDANGSGDIFAGWVIAQMDLACSIRAAERAMGRVATVSISGLDFGTPVRIGDEVCIYTDILSVGDSSIDVAVEAWAVRYGTGERDLVTTGSFTLVAIDRDGRPRSVPR